MWLIAMFDLPVTTRETRRRYARFRKDLISLGFTMLQYSVYARCCRSSDSAAQVRQDVRAKLPPEGQVRLVSITDRQFAKMEVFFGKKRQKTEEPPHQIMLF
ncbi:MAG: CRISPR-associated endonuclease Cas2 [Planctomycetota bacterium]